MLFTYRPKLGVQNRNLHLIDWLIWPLIIFFNPASRQVNEALMGVCLFNQNAKKVLIHGHYTCSVQNCMLKHQTK